MNNVYRLPDRADPTAEACEWLARIDRGLTAQEQHDLQEWLAGNPRRAEVLIESAGLWDKMNALSRLGDLFPRPRPRFTAWGRGGLALAASVVLALVVMLLPARVQEIVRQPVAPAYEGHFATAIGEHTTIHLPDGSAITLNTNSRVFVEFRDRERLLTLERGEMYVKVAHDATRPLKVFAGDRIVQAVGTEFNVEIRDDQKVDVTVTDGKVLIAVNQQKVPESAPAKTVTEDIPVAAGQRVLLGQAEQAPQPIAADDIEVKLSWRNGNLIFRGESLAEALTEIEKYTPVEFIITDEKLKTIRIAGMFKAGDVDGLLAALQQNFDISYERIGVEKFILKGTR